MDGLPICCHQYERINADICGAVDNVLNCPATMMEFKISRLLTGYLYKTMMVKFTGNLSSKAITSAH